MISAVGARAARTAIGGGCSRRLSMHRQPVDGPALVRSAGNEESSAVRPHPEVMRHAHTLILPALLAVASPAAAQQWTRVTEVPPTTFFSVWTNGDTIATTGDSTVFVST